VSRVVAYDPSWPERFEAERAELERVLAPWLDGGIHHVGSTAVPGLAAKPVIDMVAGVSDLEAARGAFEPLALAGYSHRVHRPEAHAFECDGAFHLHLTEPGSDLWRERLAFRDALRASPALRAEYEGWKAANASADGDPDPYTASKTPFVARVLAEAGIELKPDARRLVR
jgi:GrpB-like predicted nucleotidyltransferase (UPF0157 family)